MPVVPACIIGVAAFEGLCGGEMPGGDTPPCLRPLLPAQAPDLRQSGLRVCGRDAGERHRTTFGTPLDFLFERIETARAPGDQFISHSGSGGWAHGDSP